MKCLRTNSNIVTPIVFSPIFTCRATITRKVVDSYDFMTIIIIIFFFPIVQRRYLFGIIIIIYIYNCIFFNGVCGLTRFRFQGLRVLFSRGTVPRYITHNNIILYRVSENLPVYYNP